MLTQGPRRWGCSSYRIGTLSGMFMMWSSAWSPGFCCRGRQLLRGDWVAALIIMKCFCDASSRPSVHSLEPGLVPAKPPTFYLSSLHFYCSETKKGWKEWKKINSKAKQFQNMDKKSVKIPINVWIIPVRINTFINCQHWVACSIPWPASDPTMAAVVMDWTPTRSFGLFDDTIARKGR